MKAFWPILLQAFFSLICSAVVAQPSEDFSVDEIEMDLEAPMFEEEAVSSSWRDSIIPSFAYQNGLSLYDQGELLSHRFDVRLRGEYLMSQELYARMDGKLISRLPGDDQLDSSENLDWDGRLRELFVQRSADSWTVTFGFQSFAWGEMDAVQISDVITPRDYSEFAFTAPEDARLGQMLLNLDVYHNLGDFQFLYSPWPQTNRYPGGSASSLLEPFVSQSMTLDNQQPELIEDYELAFRWKQTQSGRDFSLMVASLLTNDPLFEEIASNQYRTQYTRYQMFAATVNQSAASFLWKAEAAIKRDFAAPGLGNNAHDVLEAALGFDYDANGAWSATLELFNRHIYKADNNLQNQDRSNTQILTRWSKQWLNQTLTTVYFLSYQFQTRDSVHSAALSYNITDDWLLDLNVTIFESPESDSPGQLSKNWDQLVLRITYTL